MKSLLRLIILIIFGVFITGCTSTKFGGLQMTDEMPTFTTVGEFETTVNVHKFLGASGGSTLFNLGEDSAVNPVYDAIQREIGKFGGDAAVNVEIKYGANFLQILLNSITAGLYAPSKVTITGIVVKY